ncbi:methionine--tRNA ligase [Pseudoflavonifractor capillosus]|uniref:methionine--tRNA ligase n=1 Tax=Pseudoflavonifractor capillosus TaxID=106588 RepID=UPI00195858DB|nr:methionine--tRNA ligase [Pseudoflavonifractor capillosus]MBM6897245.1 methionine--tRNA ligase [Pseudoflavonifractor capillosus]
MSDNKYYISTAIAYTSAKPHIGNTYEIVLADAIARYKRMTGYDVYFQTGTDEHGQKIQEKAEAAGITPQEYVDNVAGEIHRIWDLMNTTYDKFVRTSDPEHVAKVQKIFKRLYEQGDIYKGTYKGKYCTPCESFWTESQLVDGKCPDCGRDVKDAEEEAYFFKMSKYADRLMEYIETHPEFIQPESRKNEMINNFLKPGLQDLCVSRTSFTWGIPVDFDPSHVVYVWLDALTNYITFCGYDPDGNHEEHYKNFWPADLHLIGKDIVRFHTIYWPIFLMALGEPLPKQVFGHPWLLVGSGKMSKSTGNVIYADDLVEQFGVDAVRYFVLHEIPFANDGVMTYELMIERVNAELANILGNLVNRTIAMDQKYFGGKVMAPTAAESVDEELKAMALALPGKVQAKMDQLKVADAIDEVFALLRRANKYIDETMPWALAKDESKQERLGTVLYNLLESIRFAAVMLEPYLPETSVRMLQQLNVSNTGVESLNSFGGMPVGGTLGQAEILFNRIDKEKKLAEIEAWQAEQAKAALPALEVEPLSEEQVDFDTFCKNDLRAVKVLNCENVKKSNKLLKFTLDDGTGTPRQILSGIAQYYKPEELIGKTLVAIVNLPPRKMMGQESQGMLISAVHTERGEEKLNLLMVSDAIPAGAKLC